MKQIPKQVEELNVFFEEAVHEVRVLPHGDLKCKKIVALHAAKKQLLYVDMLARDGKCLVEAIYATRDAINKVFLIKERIDSLIIPPPVPIIKPEPTLAKLVEDTHWVQLDLPFKQI